MTDITELAQMKGQKVEGSYYLAECTDCGKMYPSNNLNGGEPLFSGDYGECYCPHCNADDAAIGDCGDAAATAWNYQQDRIDALVEALEKAHKTIAFQQGEIKALLSSLESRTVTVKLPSLNPAMFNGDVMFGYHKAQKEAVEFCAAAGIKVEVE
ncbi:TPA: hypothetical protein ACW7Y6_001440 [Klebsiella aerogenes]